MSRARAIRGFKTPAAPAGADPARVEWERETETKLRRLAGFLEDGERVGAHGQAQALLRLMAYVPGGNMTDVERGTVQLVRAVERCLDQELRGSGLGPADVDPVEAASLLDLDGDEMLCADGHVVTEAPTDCESCERIAAAVHAGEDPYNLDDDDDGDEVADELDENERTEGDERAADERESFGFVDEGGRQLSMLGPCPGCGMPVCATTEGGGAVLHPLPMCPDFEQRDALSFVSWMRARVVGPVGEA